MKNFYSVVSNVGLLTSVFCITLLYGQVQVPSQEVKSAQANITAFPNQKYSKTQLTSIHKSKSPTSSKVNRANKKNSEQNANNKEQLKRTSQQASTEKKSAFKAKDGLTEVLHRVDRFRKNVKYADENSNNIKPSDKPSRDRITEGKRLRDELISDIAVRKNANTESIKSGGDSELSPLQHMAGKAEDFSKRDATSKHFKNADGSYTAVIGAVPLHYKKNGTWQDIDTKITKTTSGDYSYANTTNLMESYFGSSAHQGILSKTKEGEVKEFLNTKMYWEVNGKETGVIQSSDAGITIKGNEAYYNNMYGDISAEFLIETRKRKLNYIIPDKKALGNIPANSDFLVFNEDVILPKGWTHSITERGILIKDQNANPIYIYNNPFSTDLSENFEHENTLCEAFLTGNILTIKIKVKTKWLLSKERKFPVYVDPTVNCFVNNSDPSGYAPTGTVTSNGLFISSWNDDIASGALTVNGNVRTLNGFAKFIISSVPAGSTINSAVTTDRISGNSTYRTNGHSWRSCLIDPAAAAATAAQIYAQGATLFWTANSYTGTGNGTQTLNAAGRTAIQSSLSQGWFAMVMKPVQNEQWFTGEYIRIIGRNGNTTLPPTGTNYRPYLVIDYTPSTCAAPTNLNVDNITSTSARFTWNAASPAPAQGYDWYYNTTGVAPTGGPSGTVGAGILSATQTGLTSNTVYHFWIRSKCNGTTSVSSWVYGGYFNTLPGQACYKSDGRIRGSVDNAYRTTWVSSTNYYSTVDDFMVPTGTVFDLKHISFEANSPSAIQNVTIRLRQDSSGPGTVLTTIWNNAAPTTSSTSYTTAFGDGVYHLTFDLVSPVQISAGMYWLEVSMRNQTNTDTWVRTTLSSNDGGIYWAVVGKDGANFALPGGAQSDMVFYVAGDCTAAPTCNPVTASANKYSVCSGDQVTISASSTTTGYTYTWYTNWDNATHTGTLVGTGASVNVNPSTSTLYGVVANKAGCPTGVNASYALITIAVTAPPSLIVLDPVNAITCSNEASQISVVSGSIIPETILNETWDPAPQNPWIVETSVWGGSGAEFARWGYTNGTYRGITSPDNSNFMVVDSDRYGLFEMESSLISPPMSFTDYNSASTNITFTFNHYFRKQTNDDAYVEITTDGVNWTELEHYTSTVGLNNNFALETINLNAYKGLPYVQIRFRYHANWDWYWAVDDINIIGTNPLPTTVTWAPTVGLWRDAAKTISYDGTQATTLYASPASTTTYTVSAKTAVGCPATAQFTVERGDKNWAGTNQNWNTATNWSEGIVPTVNHCVNIPNTTQKPIINIGTDAFAKNLTVQPGGKLEIAGNLTVTDYVRNEGATDNITVKSDGNLIQLNATAPNSGSINAERNVTDMNNVLATQMDYVYWSSPVSGQKTKNSTGLLDGFSPGTPNNRFYRYNEPNDRFYETGDPTFVPGKGYAVQAETSVGFPPTATGYSKTYNFRGTPNNGDIYYSISRSPDAGPVQHGFNLVGNPYPSNIDFDKLYTANSGKIFSLAYFWTNNNYEMSQQGSSYGGNNYAVYNGVGGNPATHAASGTGVTAIPNGIIKVGQGFIIQKKYVGGPETLDFKNSYGPAQDLRVTNSGTFFQKDGAEKNRFWLNLTAPSNLVNTQLIGYIPGATEGYEQDFDAEILGMSSDLFYSKAGDKKLLIQGKGDFEVSDKVVLGANCYSAGSYIIALETTEGIFAAGQKIYLKDKEAGVITNLSEGSYTFTSGAGLSEGRFEIVYQPEQVLATDSVSTEELIVYRSGNDFVADAKSKKITGVEVYDTAGRLIYTQRTNAAKVIIPAEKLPNSVYVLKIEYNGTVTSRKILK